jgi:hypothetical protein
MADYSHTIDRWDDVTGEKLVDRSPPSATISWPGDLPGGGEALRNRARVIEQSWED